MAIRQDDVVAVGGELDPDTLLLAYRQGVFPWPVEGLPLLWFCPRERAILEADALHVSRRLARERRRTTLRFTIDTAFPEVISACAAPRPPDYATWITADVVSAYTRLHRLGIAHSVEAWRGDALAGGVYGVDVDGAFAAESMFRREPNASKLALLHLVDHVSARGLDWIDVQVMSPHLERFGARPIPRAAFLDRLEQTRAKGLRLFP